MPTIEIPYEYNKSSLDLKDILSLIEPFASTLDWYFIEFSASFMLGADGTRKLSPPEWVSVLWHQVEESKNAVKVQWQTLRSYSDYIGQTTDALLIALNPGEKLPNEPIDLNSPNFTIVLQAFDATLWAITSKNSTLIELIRGHFKDSKVVANTSRYY